MHNLHTQTAFDKIYITSIIVLRSYPHLPVSSKKNKCNKIQLQVLVAKKSS